MLPHLSGKNEKEIEETSLKRTDRAAAGSQKSLSAGKPHCKVVSTASVSSRITGSLEPVPEVLQSFAQQTPVGFRCVGGVFRAPSNLLLLGPVL